MFSRPILGLFEHRRGRYAQKSHFVVARLTAYRPSSGKHSCWRCGPNDAPSFAIFRQIETCSCDNDKINFVSRFPPKRLEAAKNRSWHSGRRSSSPECAIHPQRIRKKVKNEVCDLRSKVTWACWLVFEEPWRAGGWLLTNQGV